MIKSPLPPKTFHLFFAIGVNLEAPSFREGEGGRGEELAVEEADEAGGRGLRKRRIGKDV